LPVNFPCLTGTPSFSRTAAVLRLEGTIHLTRNAVCERIEKSGKWLKWLCGNIFRGGGLRGEKPQWLADRLVCLTGASDEPVHGSKKADYRLHHVVELFTLEVVEMHLSDTKQGEKAENFKGIGAGDVVTGDRAYGNIRGIEYLRGCGSDFVIRLNSGAFAVYTKEGERRERSEYFEYPGEGYLPLRICARRKSGEEEDEGRKRQEKTNRKKGGQREAGGLQPVHRGGDIA
jgi:hypothetical protein